MQAESDLVLAVYCFLLSIQSGGIGREQCSCRQDFYIAHHEGGRPVIPCVYISCTDPFVRAVSRQGGKQRLMTETVNIHHKKGSG